MPAGKFLRRERSSQADSIEKPGPPPRGKIPSTMPFALRKLLPRSPAGTRWISDHGLTVARAHGKRQRVARASACDCSRRDRFAALHISRRAQCLGSARAALPTWKRETRQARKGATVARKRVAGLPSIFAARRKCPELN